MQRLSLRYLIVAVAFIGVFAMAARTPVDTDMWWHLRAGRYIVETGSVPATDPFSSTRLGAPWVDVYWLAQIGMYQLHALAGTAGLAIGVSLLVVMAFACVWRQMSGGPLLRAFVLVLAAAVGGAFWSPRPHMLTLALTAALSYILYLYKWRQIDRLWLAPIVFVLWANVHAGYVAGFLLIGSTVGGEIVHNLLRVRSAETIDWPRLRKLVGIALIAVVALLINPFTFETLALPFKTVSLGVLQEFVSEWASPDFHQLFQQPMLWMLLLTLLAIGWSGRRLDVSDAVVLTLFAYLSFVARRNFALFAIVCAPILARHAAALFERSPWRGVTLSAGAPLLNWIILTVVALAALLKTVVAVMPSTQAAAERQLLPVQAVDWVQAARPAGRVFNSYNWGGYLLWRLWPEAPVYVDGRTDVYGDDVLSDYLQVAGARPGFEAILDRDRIGWVIIESTSTLDATLSRDARWINAYRDEMAAIFIRQVSP